MESEKSKNDFKNLIDYIINNYDDEFYEEIIYNMNKIYNKFGGKYDNFIKFIKIDKTNYDLNVVFNRKPERNELARVIACVKNLEFNFKVNYVVATDKGFIILKVI
jgi:hypothetical protein